MARRIVRIRLDARSDQPWRREGFRHPDLMIWVRANRARLVAACLTLCQAWASAGRPPAARSLGSFETWSQTLGGSWRAFIQLWWDRFGSAEVNVSDLIGHIQSAQVGFSVSAKTDHALRITLGKAFRKLRDRDGGTVSGTMTFKPGCFEGGGMQFLRFTDWLVDIAMHAHGLRRVVFEEVRRHAGTDASHVYGGFLGTLTAWCEQHELPYQGVSVGTIKRYATGKGNADKAAMIAAMRARGFAPADDNEADALALLLWATDAEGGRACAIS